MPHPSPKTIQQIKAKRHLHRKTREAMKKIQKTIKCKSDLYKG